MTMHSYCIYASKEKQKSRSEKQMMLLPNTEKAIFQGVEQRSRDQVFPTSPRLIHAIVGRLPWCSLSIYDGQLWLYQGGILSTQFLEDYNGTWHSQSKRLKSSHGTSYSLSMHDGLWCKFEFKGMGRGGEVGSEGESEILRLFNWILLHGDKKTRSFEG